MNDMRFCFDIKCICGFKRKDNELIIYQKYGDSFKFILPDNEKAEEIN